MVAAGNWTRQHGRTDREPARRELSKCETLTSQLRLRKEPVRANTRRCVKPGRHTWSGTRVVQVAIVGWIKARLRFGDWHRRCRATAKRKTPDRSPQHATERSQGGYYQGAEQGPTKYTYYGHRGGGPIDGLNEPTERQARGRTEADGSHRQQAGMRLTVDRFLTDRILQPLPDWHVPEDVRFGGGGCREVFGP